MIDYPALARRSLTHWLAHGRTPESAVRAGRAGGCFVSLFDAQGELRGCIGTLEPVRDDLVDEVIDNAVSAGIRDPRFPAVTADELPSLQFEVSVMKPPEPIEGPEDLDPRRFGVIMACGARRGVLLPEIDGIDTVARQLAIVRRKAGIGPEEPVRLWRFEVEKHHERRE